MLEYLADLSVWDVVFRVAFLILAAWLGKTWAKMSKVVAVNAETFVILKPAVSQYALSQEAFELLDVKDDKTLYLIKGTSADTNDESVIRTKSRLVRLKLRIQSWLSRSL